MIKIRELNKNYDLFSLKNINLDIKKGYITGFVGQNGAGKTTLIKSILNLIHIDGGSIEIMGLDSVKDSTEIKEKIGIVLDDGVFYNHLTLKDMKKIIASFYTQWDEESYKKYMKQFRLDERKKVSELSKGMKMKFSLALALSHNADIFIMDEPTSGLDPIIREEFLEILQEIMEDESKSIFFSTHITSDLDKVADYLIFIEDGEIMLEGEKDEILSSHRIIKGTRNMLTDEIKENSIYVYENPHNFEAMINMNEFIIDMPGEEPNIDDIIKFYVKGRRK